MDWEEFTEDYDYIKKFYDVLLPSGQIIKHCWPNAGKMIATDTTGRIWSVEDNIKVKLSKDRPF